MINETMKERFDNDGYVILREFFDADELAALRSELDRLIREVAPKMPREHVFYEDKHRPDTLKQLQMLHTHDQYFHDLFLGGQVERLAETLLNDKVFGRNLQYFSKPPGVGQPTPPHQDGYYFKLSPCEALTMWLALDHVDDENGCVRYVRGSNQRGMRTHARSGVLGFSQAMTDYGLPEDLENEVDMPASPGDLLVHHALTIHSAGANLSSRRPRRSLGFIFFADRARSDEAALNAYQRQLKDDLTANGKI
ncbi:MAG: phytanoyl-CoA dioxygenase family protein [Pirellulales bacterium]|nr:phytanoyl-CoA dioxygenase family protein [Pirellulales bacterium]